MGNKMLQMSLFIALSEKYGLKIANPSLAPYSHHFKHTSTDFFCRYPGRKSLLTGNKTVRNAVYEFLHRFAGFVARKNISNRFVSAIDIGWDKQCKIDSETFLDKARRTRWLFVMGWEFKHELKLADYSSKIKAYFEPNENYMAHVKEHVHKIRKENTVLFGIHIRQGDYRTFENGRYFYETEQYCAVMKRILLLFPNKPVRFMVCSNETQTLASFAGLDTVLGPGHPVEDMYAFAHCDYILGPPSTFTMWSSFYGNKPLYMLHNAEDTFTLNDFKIKENFFE